ncbi:MAG: hypothetical protein ABI310_02485, partial [Microbacteriaceae bacterium]
GLRSVTVRGAADETVRADARAGGVQLAHVTLPELVAAFGEYEPDEGAALGSPGSSESRESGPRASGPRASGGANASAGLVSAGKPLASKKGTRS